jgi:hypothetical protein
MSFRNGRIHIPYIVTAIYEKASNPIAKSGINPLLAS